MRDFNVKVNDKVFNLWYVSVKHVYMIQRLLLMYKEKVHKFKSQTYWDFEVVGRLLRKLVEKGKQEHRKTFGFKNFYNGTTMKMSLFQQKE